MADHYFFAHGGTERGPYSAAQLRGLAGSGGILPTDPVWKEGTSQRVPASRLKNLFAAGAAPVPAPPVEAPAEDDYPGWDNAALHRLVNVDDDWPTRAAEVAAEKASSEKKKAVLTDAQELALNPDYDAALHRLQPVNPEEEPPEAVKAPAKK
jgi:hypothetical protein